MWSLRKLTRKDAEWTWDQSCQKLKKLVGYDITLKKLDQEDKGLDRPVLYESVVFSLWGQHFELLVDAKSLIEMINSPSLPNAPMTRWVAFIQLFSFDMIHVPGKTFTWIWCQRDKYGKFEGGTH